jgi:hypothetical protein
VKANKYQAIRTFVDGMAFDSKREARRYRELRILEKAGEIAELKCQVKFPLLPLQRLDGKLIERAVVYIADFVYIDKEGNKVVEDVKSPITRKNQSYILKRKMLLYFHGLLLKEVL